MKSEVVTRYSIEECTEAEVLEIIAEDISLWESEAEFNRYTGKEAAKFIITIQVEKA